MFLMINKQMINILLNTLFFIKLTKNENLSSYKVGKYANSMRRWLQKNKMAGRCSCYLVHRS
jgi:hypothetical protein